MANKTWTATALEMGGLYIRKVKNEDNDNCIEVKQDYEFLNSNDNVIEYLGVKNVQEVKKISEIPQNLLSALQTIQNYMSGLAYTQEGM